MLPNFEFLGLNTLNWGDVISYIAAFLFNILWYRKNYKFKPLQATFITALTIPMGRLLFVIIDLIHNGGWNWVRVVLYMPLAVYLVCLIFRTNYARTFDFMAPTACIIHGVSHYSCVFSGCCYGYPTTGFFRVWNERQGAYLFPIQIVEATSILIIGLGLVLYARKKNYDTHGKMYFLHMILFGATRFVYEFFRDDTPVRWQLSEFQYYCIAEFIVGLIIVIAINYSLRHPELMEKHPLVYREDVDEVTRIKLAFKKKSED